MINIDIPGRGEYSLANIVLDLNGTIALDGKLIEDVGEMLSRLGHYIKLFVVSADTFDSASYLKGNLDAEILLVKKGNEAIQKLELVKKLGCKNTVAIGNGTNDAAMLRESAIGICVMGKEGASKEALFAADVVVNDIYSAIDLLINYRRLVATLRS